MTYVSRGCLAIYTNITIVIYPQRTGELHLPSKHIYDGAICIPDQFDESPELMFCKLMSKY